MEKTIYTIGYSGFSLAKQKKFGLVVEDHIPEWKQQVGGKPAEEKKPPERSYRDRDER